MSTLVQIEGLKVHYPITEGLLLGRQVGAVRAVDGVAVPELAAAPCASDVRVAGGVVRSPGRKGCRLRAAEDPVS